MDRCWAMCRAWNERVLIPYWVRHYMTFCEQVIVYLDEDTDDGTGVLADREGAEVVVVPAVGLDDLTFVAFAQDHYKEARGKAQWVCWADADEIVYAPNTAKRLDDWRALGVNCLHTHGYSMVADALPTGDGQIYDEITRGFRSPEYDKVCLFDPELNVHWEPGKHVASVRSRGNKASVAWGSKDDPVKLLHYRYLGEAWCRERHARNWARIDTAHRRVRLGWETNPDWTGPFSVGWYAENAERAQEVVP